ncbi:glyoxalase [Flavobacteriaceae bacterium]|nr:glyoxalase [Flavobacteriaceae bacterium]
MNNRPNDLLRIRPEIKKTQQFENMSAGERFQNETLRPILKLQNPLFLAVFHNYIEKRKGVFYSLGLEKKLNYIENSLNRDQKFGDSIKGMVIGLFTMEEYTTYSLNSSALNKRMMNMVIERLKDQVQLFEQATFP